MDPRFRISYHHELVAEHFEAVERHELDVLVINMPPRSSKTWLITKNGSSWYIGRNPTHQVIASAYSDELAKEYGRDVRNKINSQDYQNVFPVQLSEDSTAKNRWHTSQGGVFISSGIGGGITGRGADLAVIDDPVKDWAEAKSAAHRKRNQDWFDTVLSTRLMPNGAIVLNMTRWDLEDLTKTVLEWCQQEKKRFKHVKIKALDEKGQSYWNSWWPPAKLTSMKIYRDPEKWLALYQQEPIVNQHSKMQRGWFKVIHELPKDCTKGVRSWDVAATEPKPGKDPDYTCGCKWFYSETLKGYIIADMIRGQWSPGDVDRVMLNAAKADGRSVEIWEEQEGGSSGVNTYTKRAQMFAGFTYHGQTMSGKGSKEIRANPLASAAQAGNIYVLAGPWLDAFFQEIDYFPSTVMHDDQVDAASLGYSKITGDGSTGMIDWAREEKRLWKIAEQIARRENIDMDEAVKMARKGKT